MKKRGIIRKPEGQIYQKDVLEIEYLNVYEGRDKVSRLEGIENLLNLKELRLVNQDIET